MKQIPLTGKRGEGKFALVDDHHYEKLSKYSWNCNGFGYAITNLYDENKNRSMILMHNMIFPDKEGLELDHKDRNRLNNTEENVRYVTRSQNNMNRSKGEKKKYLSKYKGVTYLPTRKVNLKDGSFHFIERKQPWTGQIALGEKRYSKKCYTEVEAAEFYNEKARELFGEFANLNIINP